MPRGERRSTFGNWEMDTVVSGKKGKGCALVLTERLTRQEIILPLREKSAVGTVAPLALVKDGESNNYVRTRPPLSAGGNGSQASFECTLIAISAMP